MHFDTLKNFMYVVEEKSISKAAQRIHVSQSALSQTIHKLEDDLGYALLNRSNKGVSITPEGEIVLKYAVHMVENFDKMMDDLQQYDANHNKIRITGTWSLAAYSLPCMIYRIKKKFPEIKYDLVAKKNNEEIIFSIKDDLNDFGFVDTDAIDTTLSYHKMGREKVILVAKYDYDVRDSLELIELIHLEMIMCTINKNICTKLSRALKPKNITLDQMNVIFNADSLEAVKSSVINGFGMAFVPYDSVKHELYEKLIKEVEVVGLNLDYDIYMVSKKPEKLSLSARKSRDHLIEIGRKSFC